MLKREVIEAVGYDLDECLYESDPRINNRIRNRMAQDILTKMPQLDSVEKARGFFEREYVELQSGRKVLMRAGYTAQEAGRCADEAVSQAEILDLLVVDHTVARMLARIAENYKTTFLITSSPEQIALAKLNALGINLVNFRHRIYGDTSGAGHKQEGKAFEYLLSQTGLPSESHVYIGNSRKSDIIPARNAGMQTIAVWNNIPEADLFIPHIHNLEGVLL
ncbi:HAD family hydrolase [Candidatus Pacearchaeota archaeon]|nr:HAD family hydrolase [Candidatus Pacearchaeota archaeon]